MEGGFIMNEPLDQPTTPRDRITNLRTSETTISRDDDPDETEGRKLYRAKAESLATAHMNITNRAKRLIGVPEGLDSK